MLSIRGSGSSIYLNADLDTGSQTNADPHQTLSSQKVAFFIKIILHVGISNRSHNILTYIAFSLLIDRQSGFFVNFGQFIRKRDNLLTGEWNVPYYVLPFYIVYWRAGQSILNY